MSNIDESALTKGQARKLKALRKAVGNEIGERAFADWMATQNAAAALTDAAAKVIADALWPLVEKGDLAIPRGGYVIKRGRGRVAVTLAERINGTASSAAPEPEPAPEPAPDAPMNISTWARKLIEEKGLVSSAIEGTGKNGQITKGDVLKHIAAQEPEPAAA